MSHSHYFHFTLGPVQGFVAQARRTRDFWAGSFLLAWLTARAMQAVQQHGGEIVMPSVADDALLERVQKNSGEGPSVGSLPNNFIAKVPGGFDGDIAIRAVQQAWKSLADAVWINDNLAGAGVSEILWESQIESFWDMAWVISTSDDASVLAQRKNWRSYMPPETLGDKCTMMGEWQELSGANKPNPTQQEIFWKQVREHITEKLDFPEGERLCAIAYVKRRFVYAWQDMTGHEGWKLPTSVPSVSYMAAVHWLEELIKSEPDCEAVGKFCKLANEGERKTEIAAISNALKGHVSVSKKLANVDGRLLFETELNTLASRKKDTVGEIPIEKANKLLAARKALVGEFSQPLTPFYAVLMMDGDSLGETKKALAAANKSATALSDALATFTGDVPSVVHAHNGFLIYAGGDDVLAILSLEDALPCAAACRVAYQRAFGNQKATISAAIEYAHMKLPLTMILKDAHKLLDDVAKDKTGRDAVACRVWKPGGQQQTWAMPWDIPEQKKGDGTIAHAIDLLGLVKEMEQRAEKKSDVGYSSKLLYNFREILKMVMPDQMPEKKKEIQELAKSIKELELDKLLETTYLSSGLLDGWKEKEEGMSKLSYVEAQIGKLMPLMRVHDNEGAWNGLYSADGALLLRFLAQKGVAR